MKLKKCFAVLLSAAIVFTTAVSLQPKMETEAQETVDLELQRTLGGNPIRFGKNVAGGSIPAQALISNYEKKISYMYRDASTELIPALRVNAQGVLTPTKQSTGKVDVTVSVMYDMGEIYSATQTITVEQSGEEFIMKNEAGQEVTRVVPPAVRFELAVEDPSIVTLDIENGRIDVKKRGETRLVLSGYLDDKLFGKGTCLIIAEGMDKPQSSAPAASQQPVPSAPAASQQPAPAVSQQPAPSAPAQSSEGPQHMKGDADGNNKVDLKDAQFVLKAALNLTAIDDEKIIKACDMNGSGKLELADAQIILKMALNLI